MSSIRLLDLERPARGEEVGDVEWIFRIRLRREEVACRLATNPFGDDIADVGRASGRRSDPQGHGLVIETGWATDGLVDARAVDCGSNGEVSVSGEPIDVSIADQSGALRTLHDVAG